MTGVWTPQWLYQHVTLPASTTIRIEPSAFKNDTPWPMLLKWLSVAGKVVVDDAGEYSNLFGGISRRLRFELSLTQKGDINYAAANTQTMFCGHQQNCTFNARYDFSPNFPLGPEEGLIVELASETADDDYPYVKPSISVSGLRLEPNFGSRMVPAMLAACYKSTLTYGNSVVLSSNDLYNNGEETFWARTMCINDLVTISHLENVNVGVKINPNSGIPWLPQNQFIPLGNLFPMGSFVFDFLDQGPNVYVFPQRTIMRPRQRLGVEVTNLSESEQKFGLCLHGIAEVQ